MKLGDRKPLERRPLTRSFFLHAAPGLRPKSRQPDIYELVEGTSQLSVQWALEKPPLRHVPPPEDVQRALEEVIARKGKVVIVSHTIPQPDGDAVGSTLGAVRLLRGLGVEAVGCIDVKALRADFRRFEASGELCSVDALESERPDLVIMCDVAEPGMIGRSAELLGRAGSVMVIDHHKVDPSAKALGLSDEQRYQDWVDPAADSASQMVLALVGALTKARPLSDAQMESITEPLLLGMLTDMAFGKKQKVSMLPLLQARDLIHRYHGGSLEGLEAKMRSALPESVKAILRGEALPPSLEAAVNACELQEMSHKVLGERVHLRMVPKALFEHALDEARRVDPRAHEGDLIGPLMEALDAQVFGKKAKSSISALLIELAEGQIQTSIRTRSPPLAQRIASLLGGGGKDHASAARLHTSLELASPKVLDAIREALKLTLRARSD